MNLQNLPRDDKVIKRCIVPKRGVLSFFDYSAIEPRTFAYYAAKMGDPALAKMVSDGIDPYTAIARLITGKDNITKKERQDWKVFYLSLLYGGGVTTIVKQFGCSKKEAWSMIDRFHENLPSVRMLQDNVVRVAQKRGYIVGIDGRRLHLERYGEYKLLNKLIQSSAAGVMKQAIVTVHRNLDGWDSQIINVVHDDLWIDGPREELLDLHEQVPGWMSHEELAKVVPIEVEHQVSTTSAADKVPYKDWRL